MHAHIEAIRAFSAAYTGLGTDIADVATAISKVPSRGVADAFGPVGARFALALAEATVTLAGDLDSLADRVSGDADASAAAARAFSHADDLGRDRLRQIGS